MQRAQSQNGQDIVEQHEKQSMNISTQYNLNETVFTINPRLLKIEKFTIRSILIGRHVYKSVEYGYVQYSEDDNPNSNTIWTPEFYLFKTKEEAIAYVSN